MNIVTGTGIGAGKLDLDELKALEINLPTLPEQQKTAAFFTAIDKKLQGLKEKKSLLEAYKKGVMQQLFAQEIRFKNAEGGDFEDWEVRRLGEVGESLIGLTYSPNDVVENGGVLVLRSSNIKKGTLVFEDNVFVNSEISEKNYVKENDILICARNGSKSLIGKCALIKKEDEGFAFGAFMAVYRSKYNPLLYHIFQTDTFFKQVNEHLGATINQITNKSLNSFSFDLPSLPEQTLIADCLSALDAKIAGVSGQIGAMEAWKKGLLQNMFV